MGFQPAGLVSGCRLTIFSFLSAQTSSYGGEPVSGADADDVREIRKERQNVQVVVRDNNVDQALKALKKKMQREGIFREMKLRNHYEKPSEKKAREKAEAIRRARKLARKRAQREGLVPGKRRAAR
jgi:small subunit ribosomal protein S21